MTTMIIHLIKSSPAFDYKTAIEVEEYKVSQKLKGNAVIIRYMNKNHIIPLSNIAAIEEN
jgi:hypothetical protein